jgi:thymidylate kinase
MFSVALIGADGAGKTTITRRLVHTLPLPVQYIYMGDNPASTNVMLPTKHFVRAIARARGANPHTLGPPDPQRVRPQPRGAVRRLLGCVKSALSLIHDITDEWFRQAVAWYYQARGRIVLFDRHFFSDYYASDIKTGGQRTLCRRIHGFLLTHLYPKPDLVIYLDAPAEVLFARKGEGTLESLERRRQDYLQLRSVVRSFTVVDASRSEDEVAREVTDRICDFYTARNRKVRRGV